MIRAVYLRAAVLVAALIGGGLAATPTDCSQADDAQACFATQARADDTRLNVLYQQLLTHLDASAKNPKLKTLYIGIKNQLVSSEKAWVVFRDADCALFKATRGGGAELETQLLACKLSHTQARIDDLRGWQQEIWQ